MFAIMFICMFAFLIVTVDITLLKFLIYMSRFRHSRWIGPRLERWVQDGALQLQRRAFEAQRQGSWISLDKEVPITIRRETLSDFRTEKQEQGAGGSDEKGASIGYSEILLPVS